MWQMVVGINKNTVVKLNYATFGSVLFTAAVALSVSGVCVAGMNHANHNFVPAVTVCCGLNQMLKCPELFASHGYDTVAHTTGLNPVAAVGARSTVKLWRGLGLCDEKGTRFVGHSSGPYLHNIGFPAV